MTEDEAVRRIDDGLLGPESIPAKLSRRDGLDKNQLEGVKEALRFLIDHWADRTDVPKNIAMAFMDLTPAMTRGWQGYSDAEQTEIDDASMELVELGLSLFKNETDVDE